MTSPAIDDVTERLAQTKVAPQHELSFKGKGWKLNKAEDAKELVEAIENCGHMTALRMEGNTLGVEAAEVMAKALQKHPEFERALWSDMFTGRLKTEIPAALKHLGAAIMSAGCHLVELDLSDNAFGPRGIVGLVDILKSPSCYSLQELKLNNNGLGIGGGKMLAECLLECHKSSVAAGKPLALKVFVSGRNRLENEGATALAAAFKAIGTLEELAMPQNGINLPGITALVEAIAANPRLRVLNLNDNTFTEAGGREMSKVLPKLQELEVINFGDCLIRTGGAKALAVALKAGQKKLKELILSGNEIQQAGAIAVTECIANKENLTVLDLNANQLGEGGVELVQDSMEAVGKLELLASLSDDEGSDDDEEDDVEEGEVEDDEDQPEEDEEGDVSADPHLQVSGTAITPSKQVSGKDFLAFPSPGKLQQLGPNRVQSMKEALGPEVSDPEKVIETVMRVSLVVDENDDKGQKCACDIADGLLQDVFQVVEGADSQVPNAFLVFLGLLKGEDKKYRAPSNISGPLLILNHVVQQAYFPRSARDTLSFFLSK
ncbi:hypothetical protein V1264_004794 [Littorina saxatilis]